MEKADVIVIGAGVIGLAAARALAIAGRDVIVAETAEYIGTETSARNSGVIHAGIYYKPQSQKAILCVRGKTLLYEYAQKKDIRHKVCGKLIVANSEAETEKLHSIKSHAEMNGVTDLKFIPATDARAMEPQLSCQSALFSPSTGILDIHEYLDALRMDIEGAGGIIATGNTITSGEAVADGIILKLGQDEVRARTVINAAGLRAQSVASSIAGINIQSIPKQYLAKGNYFSVSGAAPFSRLVYPVPVSGGLGAHYTMNMAGQSMFGPDVEWIEGNAFNYDVDPARAESFYSSIEKYWPGIRGRDLQAAYSGIRPKLSGAGMPDGDFVIQDETSHGVGGLINLYGIESPGITSSLAIAERIAALCRI